jgi:hypothetical protein
VIAGVVVLLEVVFAVLYIDPSTQDYIFQVTHLTDAAKQKLKDNSIAVAAVLLTVVALQLVALSLVFVRFRRLDEHYDSDTEEGGLLSAYGRNFKKKKPAQADAETALREAPVLGGGYHDDDDSTAGAKVTYTSMYDKYSRR